MKSVAAAMLILGWWRTVVNNVSTNTAVLLTDYSHFVQFLVILRPSGQDIAVAVLILLLTSDSSSQYGDLVESSETAKRKEPMLHLFRFCIFRRDLERIHTECKPRDSS